DVVGLSWPPGLPVIATRPSTSHPPRTDVQQAWTGVRRVWHVGAMPVHRSDPAVSTARRPRRAETTAWTPKQQAARRRIVEGAADLIARDGLGACTVRGLAVETGLKK